jgi:hypothetical protein
VLIVLLAIVVLVLLMPTATRQLTRRRRLLMLHGADPSPSAAWAELRDSAIDAGAPWSDGLSPRQAATRLAAWLGPDVDASEPLARLTNAEEASRYAASRDAAPASLPHDLHSLRVALRARRGRRQGLRAAMLPPSTMARLTSRRAR